MMGWLPLLAWAVGAYDLKDVVVTRPSPELTRVEYRIAAGRNSLNQFSITRVERRTARPQSTAPVILFSPFLLPGSFYEVTETGDYAQSTAGRLAMDGYDVFLVDRRRTGLNPGDCEQGRADCSVMEHWDFSTDTDDAMLALAMTKVLHPTRRPVVGGFSAGANTAMAVANRAPNAVAGLYLYEGTFYAEDPSIVQHNEPICQQLNAALDAGQTYDPSAQIYAPLLNLAATDPDGMSPFPMFPPDTTNRLAVFYVFSTPAPAGALSPTPGFVRCVADFASQRFVYTNPERLFATGPKFDNYAPLAAIRDLACGLAGNDRTHVDHLGAFRGDLLVYVEGSGFGPAMFDTVSLFPSARSVRIEHHPEFGEADPYFHVSWPDVFYAPLKDWLGNVAF